jgi:hypothetical protein
MMCLEHGENATVLQKNSTVWVCNHLSKFKKVQIWFLAIKKVTDVICITYLETNILNSFNPNLIPNYSTLLVKWADKENSNMSP